MRALSLIRLSVAVVISVCVVACGPKRVAPAPDKTLTLAGKTATYREWAKVGVCDSEVAKVKGDVESMNALLLEFLGQTSAGVDGVWSKEQLAMLEDSGATLAPALDAQEQIAFKAPKCQYEKADGVLEPAKQAVELTEQARRRLKDAPATVATVKAKLAIKEWKDKQPAAIAEGKSQWCPPKPKAGAQPDIYYAHEDETGKSEWIFCDECRVTSTAGAPPVLITPTTMDAKAKKKLKEKGYLDAAAKYPASDVSRAPKLEAPTAEEKK